MQRVPGPRKSGEWTREQFDDARHRLLPPHWWVLYPALLIGVVLIGRWLVVIGGRLSEIVFG